MAVRQITDELNRMHHLSVSLSLCPSVSLSLFTSKLCMLPGRCAGGGLSFATPCRAPYSRFSQISGAGASANADPLTPYPHPRAGREIKR